MSNFVANAADVSDDADIDYSEAVAVMSTIGVIDGVGNNSFDPDGTLTREQAAKLIAYMLLGENSEKLGVEGTSFNNVAATRWSAPTIEYCASSGIIDGAGDGNFCPAGKLTGYAFAKMLLTAIGYKSDREGFTGNSWSINVATIGMEVGLHDGLEKMFGSAKFVTATLAKEQRISDQRLTNAGSNTQNFGYAVEFGECYLPKLELKEETDTFGRLSYTYLDEYGCLLGIELVDEVKNYMFITGVDLNSSSLFARNVDTNAIFLDGKFDYEVSAVLNSGSAEVVIIRDLNESDGKTIEGGSNKTHGPSDVSR